MSICGEMYVAKRLEIANEFFYALIFWSTRQMKWFFYRNVHNIQCWRLLICNRTCLKTFIVFINIKYIKYVKYLNIYVILTSLNARRTSNIMSHSRYPLNSLVSSSRCGKFALSGMNKVTHKIEKQKNKKQRIEPKHGTYATQIVCFELSNRNKFRIFYLIISCLFA